MMRYFRVILTIVFCWLGLASANAQIVNQPAKLDRVLWERPTGWFLPLSIEVDDRASPVLYIAQKSGGVLILQEQSNQAPGHLATIAKRDLAQMDAMDVQLVGSHLYVALGNHFAKGRKSGLAIIDVSQPKKPVVQSIWIAPEGESGAGAILVKNGFAYIGAMKSGVHILNVKDPRAPKHLSTILPDIHFPRSNPNSVGHPNARGLDVVGDRLFIANDAGGLRIIDVVNKAAPKEIGQYINSRMKDKQQAYNKIIVNGRYAYIGVDYCGLEVVDIRHPQNIKQAGWWNPWTCEQPTNFWFNSPGHVNELEFDQSNKRLYMSAGDSEVIVLDVSQPENPQHIKTYGDLKDGQGVWGIALHKGKIYASYIRTFIPFNGRWSGVRAISLH